jgi:hypothetical protein
MDVVQGLYAFMVEWEKVQGQVIKIEIHLSKVASRTREINDRRGARIY